ncbi:MAG: LysM peptidoglycan-binding domain-containing protein [Deltaproteobacteria bacterium]|nr:LysM peptidoglycan-binding domain-containing protein [Deltaproteobacteria bacterium]
MSPAPRPARALPGAPPAPLAAPRALLARALAGALAGALAAGGAREARAQADISIVDDRSVHVPYEYEVEEGDTLWLISQEFFNDPWLWPNLWALNPAISNPHWIYPGDVIRLKWNPQAARDEEGEAFELEPVTYSADLQKVVRRVMNKGMILETRRDPLARVVASPEPRDTLSTGDRVYLQAPNTAAMQLGQRLSVYRVISQVLHPDSRAPVGDKVHLIATLEVLEKGDERQLVKAVITNAQQEVERGDVVVPELSSLLDVSPVKNLVDLDGVILDELEGFSELGQHHVVFVDVGAEEGVLVGNRLSVARRGDGAVPLARALDEAAPLEPVGELLVIATEPHSATALITRSTLELRRGDRVYMLRNY